MLAATLARPTSAELMLVAVHPDPLVVLPQEMGWKALHQQAQALLRETRDAVAPNARMDVETDWSVPRALERVVRRHHRDLLVLGSSRGAPEGRVRLGTHTRQLLCHAPCALAVAPRGYSTDPPRRLERIGVGFDGGEESAAALRSAAAIAGAAGATLQVCAVVDDRLPSVGWSESNRELLYAMWDELLEPAARSLREETQRAVDAVGARADIDTLRGAPPEALLDLSDHVDLLVIGSRRWGAASRVLLGSAGETLMRDSRCPVLVVPRSPTG